MAVPLLKCFAPLSPKLRAFVTGREKLSKTLAQWHKKDPRPLLWIHVASLGEFEQIRPFIEQLRQNTNTSRSLFLWLTFFSPSGYQIRHNYPLVDQVTYLPYDTPRDVHAFLTTVRPNWAVLVKNEWWPALLCHAYEQNIPIFSVGTRLHRVPWYAQSWMRPCLQSIRYFFAQDAATVRALNAMGFVNATHIGDTRYDRVGALAQSATPMALLKDFVSTPAPIVIWGSIWMDDWRHARQAIRALGNNWKHIIVPHEIANAFLKRITADVKGQLLRYSVATSHRLTQTRILLIDSVGLLGQLYAYGTMAYVGGGFRGALHNVLEPAAYGCPVLFGDRFKETKFPEAAALASAGGACRIKNAAALQSALLRWQNKTARKRASEAALACVESKKGATDKLIAGLLPYFNRADRKT